MIMFIFFFLNPKIDTENANNFLCNNATYSVTYLILTGIVHGLNTYIQVDIKAFVFSPLKFTYKNKGTVL
jgi:hypothetical protein